MQTAGDVAKLLTSMNDSMASLGDASDTRAQARAIASILAAVRGVGRTIAGGQTAKEAILNYLLINVGTPVTGDEIEAIAGMAAYSGRLADLRAEGWRIAGGRDTQATVEERRALRRLGIGHLRQTEYVLLSKHPRKDSSASAQLDAGLN